MSSVQIQGNAAGTGVFTVASPNSSSNYTLTLPAATTTLVGTDATQTLTNKTLSTGTVVGASLITSGTAVASTSGTSIDFTSIPSWVKRITVMFNGVSTSGISTWLVQLGSGSVQATGYLSYPIYVNAGTISSISGSTAGIVIGSSGSANTGYGSLLFTLVGSNAWVATGVFTLASNTSVTASGGVTLSGTLDRVRITTTNGTDTFDAGSINILYE